MVIPSGGREIISHIKHKHSYQSSYVNKTTNNCREDSSKEAEKKGGDLKKENGEREKKEKDRLEVNKKNKSYKQTRTKTR